MPMLETWEEKAGYLLYAVEYISVPRNTIPVSSNNEVLQKIKLRNLKFEIGLCINCT